MNINSDILKDYENMRLVHYNDAHTLPNTVCYDELQDKPVTGVLKASHHVGNKLIQTYTTQENHVAVIAGTRLGKTTSYVIPTVLSFARQKVKKNMVIIDPKAEIYRTTQSMLEKEGYDIKVLNFRDPFHSEYWNPLTPIFRKYRSIKALSETVRVCVNRKTGKQVKLFCGKEYESKKELESAIKIQQELIMCDVSDAIDNFALMIIPNTGGKDDAIWVQGARNLLKAFLYAMLEDSDKSNNPITEETFSIRTIFELVPLVSKIGDQGYFSSRHRDSKALRLAKNIILTTADTTRSSFLAVFENCLSNYRNSISQTITTCNSFEIPDIINSGRPNVIFVIFRDELKSQYSLITLFMQNMYTELISAANMCEDGKLPIPWYFMADEFGNFAKMNDFECVISACAGRNIFFIIIIQSYAQLNNVYGENVARIILDNLNVHAFFGSNNPETLEMFSKECGKHTIISPLSALNGDSTSIDHYQIDCVPLVTISRLSHLEIGECIITEANSGYVLLSKLERYYESPEFNSLPHSNIENYKSKVNPFDARYIYRYIPDTSSSAAMRKMQNAC